jgi:serine/threonine protein kinase
MLLLPGPQVLSLPGSEHDVKELYSEISLMRQFQHPNIVSYLGAEIREAVEQLYIFQEWVPGGSVSSLLRRFGPFSEDMTRRYTRQALQGLAYLHAHQIVHRDIKGSNILVCSSSTSNIIATFLYRCCGACATSWHMLYRH